MEEFSRTELLIKKEGLEKLQTSSVAVFGVGGVGGFVIEALVRQFILKFLFLKLIFFKNINSKNIDCKNKKTIPFIIIFCYNQQGYY